MARFKRAYPGRPYIQQGPPPAPPAAVTIQSAAPRFRLRPKTRAWVGPSGGPGDGFAAPFPAAQVVVTAYQRPSPQVRRPVPQRGQVGPLARAVGAGVASQIVTPLGTPSQAKPFVFRSPARARARVGPQASSCAAGIPSKVVTPLGYPSQPARRPVIVHLPPHRAKVGPGTYLAAGVASQITTPLGFRQQPPPRPVFVHVPPARARLGRRGQAAGGVASTAITPAVQVPAPQVALPALEFRPPPHRVLWRRVIGLVNLPPPVIPVTAGRRPAPQVKRPAPARAWVGRGGNSGGVASQVVTPLGSAQPTLPVVEFRPPPPRRVLWRGAAVPAAAPPVIPVPAYQKRGPQVRRPGPARAIWRGLASQVITPVPQFGAPPPTIPVVEFRPPPPPRGYFGPHRVIGPANLPPPPAVVTAYQRPAPQVKRPSPARAQIGPRGQVAAGVASRVVTPLGSTGPPRPFVFRSPLPPRPRGLWRGAAVKATPPTAQAYLRPAPYVKRPAPARAQTGPRGAAGGGVASRIVTPLGQLAPPRKVQIFPPHITRARVGPGTVAGGFAAAGPVPTAQAYQRPVPYIKRPAPARAKTGPRGVTAGGITGQSPVPAAQPYQRPGPYIKRPAPARASTGPRGMASGGFGGTLPVPAAQARQRPAPQVKRPAPARAWVGRGGNAGGVASQIVTPLGSLPVLHRPLPPQAIRPAPHRVLWRRVIGLVNLPPPPPPVVPPPVTVLVAPAVPMTIVIDPAVPMTITVGSQYIAPPGQQLITQQSAVLLRPA